MIHDPVVSVIIPTLDRPTETARAVASALAQTERRIEVIVVDDGSRRPDLLHKELDRLADPRILLHCLGSNQGGNHARNVGVQIAKADLVAFLDSDDEWLPQKLAMQLDSLRTAPASTLVYSQAEARFHVGNQEVSRILPARGILPHESVQDYLFCNGGSILTPTIMMRREMALRVPFDERLRRHQEYGLFLSLARHGCRFLMSPTPLVRVDWRGLRETRRHLDVYRSREFLELYGPLMSAASRGGFWIRNVVLPLYGAGMHQRATRELFRKGDVGRFLLRNPAAIPKLAAFLLGIPHRHGFMAVRRLRRLMPGHHE